MRHRKPIEKLTEIKDDPKIPVVFPEAFYKGFFGLYQISNKHHLNIAVLSRHVLLNWFESYDDSTDEIRAKMVTEVLQSIHGIKQLSLFGQKLNAPGGTITKAWAATHKKQLVKRPPARKGVAIGKKGKLESKSAR